MKDRETFNHESYGMASFGRVSSSPGAILFGSEFQHGHYMMLTICHGELIRDLSNDWYHAGKEIVRVALSEAQFVELITRQNMGGGTPVTLQHVGGKAMADCPAREKMDARHHREMESDAARCTDELIEAAGELTACIDSGKIGKTQLREIAKKLEYAALAIKNGIPFVRKQFEEAMEHTITQAKVEIEAHVSQTVMRIGLETLREDAAKNAPKLLEGTK